MKPKLPIILVPKSWFLPVSKMVLGLLREMADSRNKVQNIQHEPGAFSSTCPRYYNKEGSAHLPLKKQNPQ